MDEQGKAQAEQPELNADLAGYPDTASLVKGYRESGSEAKKQRERAEQAEALVQQLLTAQEANPRPSVKQRGRPQDRLSEFGIPVDALGEFLDERLQEAFEPIAKGITARTTLQAEYPDYAKFEADVAQFVQSDKALNETYNRLFKADPVGAFEYAFLKFGESRRRGSRSGMPQEEAAHAAIPSGRNGEARRVDFGAGADTQKAWERYQRTGNKQDMNAYVKARLRTVVTDDFLNQ